MDAVKVRMPDGTAIWVRTEGVLGEVEALASSPNATVPTQAGAADEGDPFGGEQGTDISLRRRRAGSAVEPHQLSNFVETVQSVAASVRQAVAGHAPTSVSVEFGIELSIQTGQFVAMLAQAGARTSVVVRLDWDTRALHEAHGPAAVAEEPGGEAAGEEPDGEAAAGGGSA